MIDPGPIPKNCTLCGACCCHETDPLWVEVTAAEAKKMSSYWLVKGDIEPYAMKFRQGRCGMLAGVPGVKVHCMIYPMRPGICQKIQPGDEVCRARLLAMRAKERAPQLATKQDLAQDALSKT